jgi:hypothetical protein
MLNRLHRGLAVAVAGLLFATASAGAESAPAAAPIPTATPAQRALLKDAIDIHTHLDPDSFGPNSSQAARRLDVLEMAGRARKAGMRGFVIKQHYDQTAGLAYIVTKIGGVEAFGMLCMNLTVGGLNPAAVYHFAEVKGGRARIVSMPTWDSQNNVGKSANPTRASVAVSKGGELLPEAKAVIAAVAAAKVRDTGATLALATGHISAEEGLMVVREARRQGVQRIVVTHAIGAPVNMTLAQMQEAVRAGAYIEFVAGMTFGQRATFTAQQYYDAIRALGPERVILSSDGGQIGQLYPDDLIAILASQLRDRGLTMAELHTIMVENPAKLLGIPQPGKS